MLEFDRDAAEALGIVTLLASGTAKDAHLAGQLLDELLSAPGGPQDVVRGLAAVCGGLLALLEFHGSVSPRRALGEIGHAIAEATTASQA